MTEPAEAASEAASKLVVAVGSKNPVKVNSVRNAFAANFPGSDLEVVGYSVPSGVDDQPWGDVQTRQGALNRAENALGAHCLAHGGAPPDYAVGLEGGVVEEKLGELHQGTPGLSASYTTCFAFMAVMSSPTSLGGVRWGIARTGSFALPPRITALMKGEGGKPPLECAPARQPAPWRGCTSTLLSSFHARLTLASACAAGWATRMMRSSLTPTASKRAAPLPR